MNTNARELFLPPEHSTVESLRKAPASKKRQVSVEAHTPPATIEDWIIITYYWLLYATLNTVSLVKLLIYREKTSLIFIGWNFLSAGGLSRVQSNENC